MNTYKPMRLRTVARASSTPVLLSVIAVAVLGGCTTVTDSLTSSKVDYRSSASAPTSTLQVPPDLTQLTNDPRYQAPTGSVVSANELNQSAPSSANTAAAGTSPAAAQATVALNRSADTRIERAGSQRWLVTRQTPEQLWPLLRTFWQDNGFPLLTDSPQTGVLETDWAENRAKLPSDVLTRTIGSVLDRIRDSGERDRYRMRVERSGAYTEVYISHRGAEEVKVSGDTTRWQARPSDPNLEAEMLARLLLRVSGQDESPKPSAQVVESTVKAIGSVNAAPARARATPAANGGAALQVDDTLERSWRRVGLALDRSSFTVEERDRTQNSYAIRYVDPKLAGQEEPGFFSRMFSGAKKGDLSGTRYRLLLSNTSGNATTVGVMAEDGSAAKDEGARQIVDLLVNELK